MGGSSAGGILPGLASQFLGGGSSGGSGSASSIASQFLGSGSGGSGGLGSFLGSGIGKAEGGGGSGGLGGYGGGPLGAGPGGQGQGGGSSGGNAGFIGLITNAVKEVGNMQQGGGKPGDLLKNIDANQISNILSAL